MRVDLPSEAKAFRRVAERCFALAEKTMDAFVRAALTAYGYDLLRKAERLEASESRRAALSKPVT